MSFSYTEWCNSHCYRCGRTNESIIIDGPTPECMCDTGDPENPPISDLEFEALKDDAYEH